MYGRRAGTPRAFQRFVFFALLLLAAAAVAAVSCLYHTILQAILLIALFRGSYATPAVTASLCKLSITICMC